MEQTQFYIVNVKVKEGFIIDGNKNRLYEKGDVFSYRTGRKPKITNGFLIEFPDKHIVFVDENNCLKQMINKAKSKKYVNLLAKQSRLQRTIDKTKEHGTFLPRLVFNKEGSSFWNYLDKLGEESSN